MKWIVMWVVLTSYSVPCNNPSPSPDAYGRLPSTISMTLMACAETIETSHQKEFDSESEARKFIEDAPKCLVIGGFPLADFKGCIKDIKLLREAK